MRRYNIFTLGIILTSIYSINAMAAWPTKPATGIWTNSEHTTLAQMRCGDCCKSNCWLLDGTYYDAVGTFTETCGCPSGTYDIGFSSCISADTNGTDYGYRNTDDANSYNTATYDLTADKTWGVTFDYGVVKGIASCNGTPGTHGVATTTNFSQSSTGQYCWCKMTSPAASRWVFYSNNGDANICAGACANLCGAYFQLHSDFRSGFFGSVEPDDTPPTCDSNRTYSMVNGVCKGKLSCPSGSYDIGFSSCINPSTDGSDYGYWDFGGRARNTTTYGLTAGGQWGATLYTGDKVTGIASCNSTNGSRYVATTTNFDNTSNGKYCWCKMTSPAASRWVLLGLYDNAGYCDGDCASLCADYCADAYGEYVQSDFRVGVFGSVEF